MCCVSFIVIVPPFAIASPAHRRGVALIQSGNALPPNYTRHQVAASELRSLSLHLLRGDDGWLRGALLNGNEEDEDENMDGDHKHGQTSRPWVWS